MDALGRTIQHDILDRLGGNRDDREVHSVGDVSNSGVRRESGHRSGARIDGVHAPREVTGHEIPHQRLTDRVLTATGTDHGHGARVEERVDRCGFGTMFAVAHQGDGVVGGIDRELQHHDAVFEAAADVIAGLAEGLQHPGVVGKHLGNEALDSTLASCLRQMLQEHMGDATALMTILDQEGDFRFAGADPVVASDRDHLAGNQHDEGHPIDVVDLGEPCVDHWLTTRASV